MILVLSAVLAVTTVGAQVTYQAPAVPLAPPVQTTGPAGHTGWNTPGVSVLWQGLIIWRPGAQGGWNAAAKAQVQWAVQPLSWPLTVKAGADWVPPVVLLPQWRSSTEAQATWSAIFWDAQTVAQVHWNPGTPTIPLTWRCQALGRCRWIFKVGVGERCVSGDGVSTAAGEIRNYVY